MAKMSKYQAHLIQSLTIKE